MGKDKHLKLKNQFSSLFQLQQNIFFVFQLPWFKVSYLMRIILFLWEKLP